MGGRQALQALFLQPCGLGRLGQGRTDCFSPATLGFMICAVGTGTGLLRRRQILSLVKAARRGSRPMQAGRTGKRNWHAEQASESSVRRVLVVVVVRDGELSLLSVATMNSADAAIANHDGGPPGGRGTLTRAAGEAFRGLRPMPGHGSLLLPLPLFPFFASFSSSFQPPPPAAPPLSHIHTYCTVHTRTHAHIRYGVLRASYICTCMCIFRARARDGAAGAGDRGKI